MATRINQKIGTQLKRLRTAQIELLELAMPVDIIPHVTPSDINGKRLWSSDAMSITVPTAIAGSIALESGFVVLRDKTLLNFTLPRTTYDVTEIRSGVANVVKQFVKQGPTVELLNIVFTLSTNLTDLSPIGTVVGTFNAPGVAVNDARFSVSGADLVTTALLPIGSISMTASKSGYNNRAIGLTVGVRPNSPPVLTIQSAVTLAIGVTDIATMTVQDPDSADNLSVDFVVNPGDAAQIMTSGGVRTLQFKTEPAPGSTHHFELRPFDGVAYGQTRSVDVTIQSDVAAGYPAVTSNPSITATADALNTITDAVFTSGTTITSREMYVRTGANYIQVPVQRFGAKIQEGSATESAADGSGWMTIVTAGSGGSGGTGRVGHALLGVGERIAGAFRLLAGTAMSASVGVWASGAFGLQNALNALEIVSGPGSVAQVGTQALWTITGLSTTVPTEVRWRYVSPSVLYTSVYFYAGGSTNSVAASIKLHTDAQAATIEPDGTWPRRAKWTGGILSAVYLSSAEVAAGVGVVARATNSVGRTAVLQTGSRTYTALADVFVPVLTMPTTASLSAGVTSIATLGVSATDSGQTITFDFASNPGSAARVSTVGGVHTLRFVSASVAGTYAFQIRPFDGVLYGVTRTIAVTVEAAYVPFTLAATRAVNVPENTTAVATITTTGGSVTSRTFYIVGGDDAARFAINASTGALSFIAAPDFEAPTDAGGNNVYDVTVRVTDGTTPLDQALAVTVTDAADSANPEWPADTGTYLRMLYVTTAGGGNGLSVGSPTTLAAAVAMSQPGDKIAVRAGSYGTQSAYFQTSGTATNPIHLVGYTTTPPTLTTDGDTPKYGTVAITQEPATTHAMRQLTERSVWHAGTAVADPALMPVLDAGTRENYTYGVRIPVGVNHIHVRGITVMRHGYLFHCLGANCRFEDIYGAESGTVGAGGSIYAGFGLTVTRTGYGAASTTDGLLVRNAWMVNCNAQAFSINSNAGLVMKYGASCNYNATVAGDTTAGATDYYVNITGGVGLRVIDGYVYRDASLVHNGHGVELKPIFGGGVGMPITGVTIDGVYAVNVNGGAVGIRGGAVSGNTIRNVVSVSTVAGAYGAAIIICEGAHDNLIERVLSRGNLRGIFPWLNGEMLGDNPGLAAGYDNTLRDITMRGVATVIGGASMISGSGKLNTTTIENLTVTGATTLYSFGGAGAGTGNVIRDSAATGIGTRGDAVTSGQWALENSTGFPA